MINTYPSSSEIKGYQDSWRSVFNNIFNLFILPGRRVPQPLLAINQGSKNINTKKLFYIYLLIIVYFYSTNASRV